MSARFPHPIPPRRYVVRGTFIDAPTPTALRVRRDCEIVVSETGTIESIADIDRESTHTDNDDDDDDGTCYVVMEKGQVVCPGLIDCNWNCNAETKRTLEHVHAPQFQQLGTKTDVPLVEWLNQYTFPAEAAFSDLAHATSVYTALVRRLLRNGTTTALYFASNHLAATKVLAELCAAHGQRAFVGKTCSDQFLPAYYVETTEASLADTEEFIVFCRDRWGGDGLVRPVVTPRFVPTCSRRLLQGLGALAAKYSCHIQTHAAESIDEVAWVSELYPVEQRDIKILQGVGLLTSKTVLAHCCHLRDAEVLELVSAGAAIVSCPYSNILFARATVPIPRFRALGLTVGLGTDIAGGMSSSLWANMRLATLQDRIDSFAPSLATNWSVDYKYAFHLATAGGARALGVQRETGCFEVGMQWDAVLLDCGLRDMAFDGAAGCETDAFERFVNCGDDRNIVRVWVGGKTVCQRD